ncbi:ferritin-like domain-containing protein [Acidisphaera sp. L21]|uniref:ferritin-like domain-containing protein n=1 Tax=Acidisphaera sp. L21 TaxID=1641851 RepID=UPI00131E120E|nr:ferritin-like domain-containing protein [Acidisphaera sp. L21]
MADNDQLIDRGREALERRAMFKRAGMGVAGAAAFGLLAKTAVSPTPAQAATTPQTPTGSPTQLDLNILNFALNLEYLEAQFYLNALTGTGLTAAQLAGGNGQVGGTPVAAGKTAVSFATPIVRQLAQTIAADELAHVLFLKGALGTAAVPAPVIDVSAAGAFTTLAVAAGLISAGQIFNPYQDENAFLLGAYIFEDVGVTAYGGAAALLSQPSALVQYAASILAMEAYHAGTIRTLLTVRGGGGATDAVSNLRSMLSSGAAPGTAQGDDFGTFDTVNNVVMLAPRDANALSYRRSVQQVLNIVYGNSGTGRTSGLFFPNGLSQAAGVTGFA